MSLFQVLSFISTVWYVDLILVILSLMVVGFFYVIIIKVNVLRNKNSKIMLMNENYAKDINNIRKEHIEAQEKIRVEMLKREDERTRQWIESEKETLHVLGGVLAFLDLNDDFENAGSERIINKLEEINKEIKIIISDEQDRKA
jgi:hypothetical protein